LTNIVNLIKYIVNLLPVLPGIARLAVIVLACRFFSVQRFARYAGTLRFSRQVARSQTRPFNGGQTPIKTTQTGIASSTCRCDARLHRWTEKNRQANTLNICGGFWVAGVILAFAESRNAGRGCKKWRLGGWAILYKRYL